MNNGNLKIRGFEKKDISEVKRLINQVFGTSYTRAKPNLFEQATLIVAVLNFKVVGFCAGDISEKNVGLLDMLVVHPSFQNQGIGTALFKARMDGYSKRDISNYILYHWVQKGLSEPKIAIKYGFELKEIIPNFWKEESKRLSYQCAECGPPPCECTCCLYVK
ncbi:MAG: N-acetylglutamate synthase-like GNAT family acetyltransferase [Saprospiraceae bacterium]|jgi:N-acetylglutamate synthase-like GNAT family acetyltransferase